MGAPNCRGAADGPAEELSVASRHLDLLAGLGSSCHHHASCNHRLSFRLHARRRRGTGWHFSVLLLAAWNFLRLSGHLHLAVSWRDHRKEPALLLPCSSETGSASAGKV